jgi:hypothetical protein
MQNYVIDLCCWQLCLFQTVFVRHVVYPFCLHSQPRRSWLYTNTHTYPYMSSGLILQCITHGNMPLSAAKEELL